MKNVSKQKGQGGLEYLLLIGGAVLIAVIVIALLVGMGSENSAAAKNRNAQLMESTDTPIPSTISKITCLENGDAIVNWTPVYKDDYNFSLSVNGALSPGWDYGNLSSTTNPILAISGCSDLPATFIITTRKGDKTAASNSMIVGEEEGTLKVSKPVATPSAGTDTGKYVSGGSFLVSLASSTPGANIYYTIDGTTPTESSSLYSSSINIMPATETGTVILKSRAYDPTGALPPSNILSKNFYFVHKPAANQPTGTYSNPISVTLSDTKTSTPKSIYYTLDGTTPTDGSTLYSGAINITTTKTLKAITYKSGVPGDVETYTYTITATPTVATPVASLVAGTYNNNQTVTLACTTPSAQIRYTTDGTDPTPSSQLYSGAISINGTTTLKAKGYLAGYNESSLLNNVYTLKVATPVATPSGGEVSSGSTVTLTNSTLLNTMRYTTNGPAPSCMGSGTIYTTPITINSTTTLRVIGCKTNYSNSDILTAVYTIPVVLLDPPSATPVGGSFPGPVTVKLTLPKAPNLEIYYKLTDAEPIKDPPTNKDTPYKAPINITTTKWLSAITYNPSDGTYSKDYLSERYMIIK